MIGKDKTNPQGLRTTVPKRINRDAELSDGRKRIILGASQIIIVCDHHEGTRDHSSRLLYTVASGGDNKWYPILIMIHSMKELQTEIGWCDYYVAYRMYIVQYVRGNYNIQL